MVEITCAFCMLTRVGGVNVCNQQAEHQGHDWDCKSRCAAE